MLKLRYDGFAKLLHWLIALAVIILICVGWYMADLRPSPDKIRLYVTHKSLGLTVLALMTIRALWRLSHQPPPLPQTIPAWQRSASMFSHLLLYVMLFMMPLSGWLMNSASGFPAKWFGLFKVPNLIARDSSALELWQDVHFYSAWILMTLIFVHIAAALKHHFIDRDSVLLRMLPFNRRAP